jgi:hypothetical protein
MNTKQKHTPGTTFLIITPPFIEHVGLTPSIFRRTILRDAAHCFSRLLGKTGNDVRQMARMIASTFLLPR